MTTAGANIKTVCQSATNIIVTRAAGEERHAISAHTEPMAGGTVLETLGEGNNWKGIRADIIAEVIQPYVGFLFQWSRV